jgi:hypothetical protein
MVSDMDQSTWIGIVVLSLYLLLVLFAATSYIRLANLRWLQAHEDALQGRLAARTGDQGQLAKCLLAPPESTHPKWDIVNPANWVGSSEIARWVRLHEAQRLEIFTLSDEALFARFARAMGQIDELPAVRQSAWQRQWVALQALSAKEGPRPSKTSRAKWEAELSQLLAELFNARDSTYNQLVSLYGKAGWLVLVSYLAVITLFFSGFGPVLLAGFLGGLVSRLQRLVYAKGRPTAYGASWVPLFLAPLLGALVAWGGLHLLAVLQSVGIANLQSLIPPNPDFKGAVSASTLGVAVLFGFSERFFNQLGATAESVVSGDKTEQSAAAAGSPAVDPSYLQSGLSTNNGAVLNGSNGIPLSKRIAVNGSQENAAGD